MKHSDELPLTVKEAFPALKDAIFVEQLALPDTTFDIYTTGSGNHFALVTTDYADPYDQSRELKRLSGQYEFEFNYLLRPVDGKAIKLQEHDEMDGDFFVTAPYKNYKLYYYLASLKHNN